MIAKLRAMACDQIQAVQELNGSHYKDIIITMDLFLLRGKKIILIMQLKSRNNHFCYLNICHLHIQTLVTCNLQVCFIQIPCLIGLYTKMYCFQDSCKPADI